MMLVVRSTGMWKIQAQAKLPKLLSTVLLRAYGLWPFFPYFGCLACSKFNHSADCSDAKVPCV